MRLGLPFGHVYGNIRFVYKTICFSIVGIVVLFMDQFVDGGAPSGPPILTVAGASINGVTFIQHVYKNGNDRFGRLRVGRTIFLIIALGVGFLSFLPHLASR